MGFLRLPVPPVWATTSGTRLGVGHCGRAARPNIGLQATANSLRSSLAAAIGGA